MRRCIGSATPQRRHVRPPGDARARSPLTNDRILRSERGNQNAFPRFSGVCRASVRRPLRRPTLKRDEQGARFFLHQETRRLACVPTKNENRDLESRANIHETVRQTILHAVPPTRGTERLTRWTW